MINYIDLAKRLERRSLGASLPYDGANTLMPTVYQFGVTGSRPYQDDHFLFKGDRRMDHFYRFPLPTFKIAGNADPEWTPYQPGYPLVPGTEIKMLPVNGILLPHILTMHPVHRAGQWSRQGFKDPQDNYKLIECYQTWSTPVIFGRYFYHNRGLKPDVNAKALEALENPGLVGDCGWTWFEWSGPQLKRTR